MFYQNCVLRKNASNMVLNETIARKPRISKYLDLSQKNIIHYLKEQIIITLIFFFKQKIHKLFQSQVLCYIFFSFRI